MPSSSREVVRALEQCGFEHIHTRGRHARFRHPATRMPVTVPLGYRDLPAGTFASIVRQLEQAGVSREEFLVALASV